MYYLRPTFTEVVAQSVRASDCGSEGRGFETRLPPQVSGMHFASLFYFLHGMRYRIMHSIISNLVLIFLKMFHL
jgi:hypothetical protein